jgi:hypothetical protein
MKINKFIKCFNLWKEVNNNTTLGVMISDINHNDEITENSWEQQCEWRLPDANNVGVPAEKPNELTWSSISSYETQAEQVADFSN